MRRAFATASSVAVLTVTALAPAIAGSKNDDGEDRGTAMSTTSAVLWFVVVPLAVSAIIALFVMAPGWIRSAQRSTQGGFLDDPTLGDRLEVEGNHKAAIES